MYFIDFLTLSFLVLSKIWYRWEKSVKNLTDQLIRFSENGSFLAETNYFFQPT